MAPVRVAHTAGRSTVLVSMADHRCVERAAADLSLFGIATGTGNAGAKDTLPGESKAGYRVARYGTNSSDHIGDGPANLPIRGHADRIFALQQLRRPSGRSGRPIRRAGQDAEAFDDEDGNSTALGDETRRAPPYPQGEADPLQ